MLYAPVASPAPAPAGPVGRAARALALAGLALLAIACASVSPADSDALLDGQLAEARREAGLADAPPRVLYAGFGLHDGSRAFRGDVESGAAFVRSVDPRAIVVRLFNGNSWPHAKVPLATQANVQRVLRELGALARPQDRIVLLFTSHGLPGALVHKLGADASSLPAGRLAEWLQPIGQRLTLVVVSACYSGSMIKALSRENRAVLTAAAADRRSFGCGTLDANTYFVEELFGRRVDASVTLREHLRAAAQRIEQREKSLGQDPSKPQLAVGKAFLPVMNRPLSAFVAASPDDAIDSVVAPRQRAPIDRQ